jgi:hypothetical protein
MYFLGIYVCIYLSHAILLYIIINFSAFLHLLEAAIFNDVSFFKQATTTIIVVVVVVVNNIC